MEHRADAVFTLPELPRRAVLVGDPPGWGAGLAERGVELTATWPDLAVAAPGHAAEALATGAGAVIVDGGRDAAALLRDAGMAVRRLLPLPLSGAPLLYADIGQRRAAAYTVRQGIVHRGRRRAARNRLAAELLARGAFPAIPALVTAAARQEAAPEIVRVAAELGAPAGCGWSLLVAPGSVVRRDALLLFPPGERCPAYVAKFARVPDSGAQFDRDERGWRLVRSAGGALARRAPTLLGRGVAGRHHVSLETAAHGTKLANLLRRPLSRRRKLEAVEAVARWLVEVARETAVPAPALAGELERLRAEVLPAWAGEPCDPSFADRLPPLPASFQHNDLAEENLVFGSDGFLLLDWEWAQPRGIPVGDLVYFAVHVLRLVDGRMQEAERDAHFEELVCGRAPSSPVMFRWLRELVATLALPPEAVGPLVTLSWLDRASVSRRERLRAERSSGRALGEAYAERCARTWLTHPALGPTWTVWRELPIG